MSNRYIGIALAAAFAIPVVAEAAPMDFSYGTPGEEFKVYGNKKKETYDIAIRLGSEMAGAKVMGFTVPLPVESGQVANLKGWLSSELKLENKKNVADLGQVTATLDNDWNFTASFPDGVTVPEGGIYVGYSFDVTSFDSTEEGYSYPKEPIACVSGTNPDGLYIHTSRTVLKWKSLVNDIGGAVSPMVVKLEGDFSADAASVAIPAKPYVEINRDGTVSITVTNHGSNAIKDIHYVFEANGTKGDGSYTFATPIAADFGATGTATITLPPFKDYGTYPLSVTVDRVNGVENNDRMRTATTDFTVAPFVPVNRPLVEEYTGLWCGYCPAGYVAIEELTEELGKDFVVLSYHDGDAMTVMEAIDYPIAQFQSSISFPESQVNRRVSDYPDTETLRALWEQYSADFSPANIDVKAEWADEAHSSIKATASVKFVEKLAQHNYRVAFALVADSLTDPRFIQQNYYGGDEMTGKWWDIFTKGPKAIPGLTFNSIVAATSPINGVEGSLPATLEMGQEYAPEYTFAMKDVLNTDGEELLNSGCRLRVVAYIVDTASKHVLNSNSSEAISGYVSGIEAVEAADAQGACEYYNLQGIRVANPTEGIYIRVQKQSDGRTVTTKVRL